MFCISIESSSVTDMVKTTTDQQLLCIAYIKHISVIEHLVADVFIGFKFKVQS